jgi:pseudouridine kinase
MTEREREILGWIKENPMISQQEIADRANIARSSAAVHISNLMKKGKIRGKGYVLAEETYVTVIGGANMDISGTPTASLVMGDSNPGKITISRGGVGRNIAENLSRLGVQVEFITVLGDDVYGQEILKNCRELGMHMEHTLVAAGESTSTYLCINDERGEMEVAVNEMDLYRLLTPEYLEPKLPLINRGQLLILDANLTEEAIVFLAEHCRVPILAEPVSAAKSKKFYPILDKLYGIKPNRLELSALTGISATSERNLFKAATELINKGVKEAYISLSSEGVLCVNQEGAKKLPCFGSQVVNSTGCGDAFMAAIAWASLKDKSLEEKTRAGLAAAAICIEAEGAINTGLTEETLEEKIKGGSA